MDPTPKPTAPPIAGEALVIATAQEIQRRNNTGKEIDQAERNLVQLRNRLQVQTETVRAMTAAMAKGEAYQP